jgi:hypothetical protein
MPTTPRSIDKGALSSNPSDDILSSQYRRHPATN